MPTSNCTLQVLKWLMLHLVADLIHCTLWQKLYTHPRIFSLLYALWNWKITLFLHLVIESCFFGGGSEKGKDRIQAFWSNREVLPRQQWVGESQHPANAKWVILSQWLMVWTPYTMESQKVIVSVCAHMCVWSDTIKTQLEINIQNYIFWKMNLVRFH